MSKRYKIGTIFENELGQFAKVVSIRNGVYGLAGWAARKLVEKATSASVFLNGYGLRNANLKIVSSTAKAAPAEAAAKKSEPAAPKAAKPKSTIAKPAVKKAAKKAQKAQKPAKKSTRASK